MPLVLLGIAIAAILIGVYRRYAPPPAGARIFAAGEAYILIDDGMLRVRQGFIPARAVAALADVLREAGISRGRITLSKDRRVAVSWHVPPALHQKIRNVLLCD
jgi:Protein of unknown function (DUF3634)